MPPHSPPSIDWQQIDTVLLDMDGTLLDLHFDNYFWLEHLPAHYAQVNKLSREEAKRVLEHQFRSHEGTLNWYCLDHWSAALQLNVGELKREVQHKICVRPYVEGFLASLKALDKKLVLITNAHQQSLQLKLEVTQINRWLDVVISSHQFKYPKEHQEFWQRLHAIEQFDPERTLFIDDTVRILKAAENFGIRHLLCIHQPDSQRPRRVEEYPAIYHFDEIMP
ncbi:GMP/IMP nucleotidase [Halioxenophilus sp. WMMB6]|uniref:GMP/IMP nucleotidase n=1 Tax=Halioxenophilus sp. WMMB6 TaxID=3073815 RepID=UPI00295F211B|nr:GMP/IMP nucleotidase [Halioxenophilus sp. WMMB6]